MKLIRYVADIPFVFIFVFLSVSVSVSVIRNTDAAVKQKQPCNGGSDDVYKGEWVYDESYPIFDSSKCKSIRREFSCLRNGRSDRNYLNYRWQPSSCTLPKFDGIDFLRRLKGKKVLFVGDSVSDNQWQSLVCMLQVATGEYSGAAAGEYFGAAAVTGGNSTSTVRFQKYGVSISMLLSHYLVDIENRKAGRVLNLDSIKDGEIWEQYDVVIFNTWLWWYRSGPKQPWDYIEYEGKITKDMDRMEAFRKALTTWAKWVNSKANPKAIYFFQGISPMHYRGEDWNKPGVKNCANETTPLKGSLYRGGEPLASKVLKDVLNTQVSPPSRVHLLDITTLSQLRKDGHPGTHGTFGMDCTHWCIAGVIDTWNLILYSQLIRAI
ncbi:protein trichome birefringence-like 41 [Andrographis paniculata]|uniref:protein trichome birefringence-like 41 n=1 Tax=Andrographis paniculata TaxID=175694 RepID=UPI0021E87BC4|nr:protein trichome birefringence-like 41 [Andrographis paniculata]